MKSRLVILFGFVLFAGSAFAGPWSCTSAFADYMQQVTNPTLNSASPNTPYADYGKVDTVYYPYPTPYGLRIGYGSVPTSSELTAGLPLTNARGRLIAGLDATAATLSTYIPANYPGKSFEALDGKLQEVLVDYAYTEGHEAIPPALVEAVFGPDPWKRILRDMLYVRMKDGLLQPRKNKTFYERNFKIPRF